MQNLKKGCLGAVYTCPILSTNDSVHNLNTYCISAACQHISKLNCKLPANRTLDSRYAFIFIFTIFYACTQCGTELAVFIRALGFSCKFRTQVEVVKTCTGDFSDQF
jgi:hypothetical protein